MRSLAIVIVTCFMISSGCDSASTQTKTTLTLETEDPRFEIFLERLQTASNTEDSKTHQLTLRVQSKTGWHIEPDAPTRLDLDSPADLEIDTPLRGDAKEVTSSREKIEFAIAYQVTDRAISVDRDASAKGRLKFGVCREGNLRCEIVNRELQIPLH